MTACPTHIDPSVQPPDPSSTALSGHALRSRTCARADGSTVVRSVGAPVDDDLVLAVGREWVSLPVCPTILKAQTSELRHEIQL